MDLSFHRAGCAGAAGRRLADHFPGESFRFRSRQGCSHGAYPLSRDGFHRLSNLRWGYRWSRVLLGLSGARKRQHHCQSCLARPVEKLHGSIHKFSGRISISDPDGGAYPPNVFVYRRCISSGDTFSMLCPIVHRCPNGSRIEPERSP